MNASADEDILEDDIEMKSNLEWALDYHSGNVAALQSPHGLRLRIDEGDESFILVDVRKQEFYERGHIVGAVHISTDQTKAEVLEDFQKLKEENPGKEIIIYCYSASCMNGRKVSQWLLQNNLFVKELTIGYNEWEQSPEIWNYPQEEYNINDYIVTGSEPGEYDPITEPKNVSCGNVAFAC